VSAAINIPVRRRFIDYPKTPPLFRRADALYVGVGCPAEKVTPMVKDGPEKTEQSPRREDLPPAAQRALAEAEERRRLADLAAKNAPPKPKEINGPKGPEPTRYGDWERKGICSDF
jgi:hypothetical protein